MFRRRPFGLAPAVAGVVVALSGIAADAAAAPSDQGGRLTPSKETTTVSAQEILGTVGALALLPLETSWPKLRPLRASVRSGPVELAESLATAIESADETARLLIAELLTDREEESLYRRGHQTLVRIARNGRDKQNRIAAMRLLGRKRYDSFAFLTLRALSRESGDDDIRIQASVSLYALENDRRLVRPLFDFLGDDDLERKQKAALALARIGFTEFPLVEDVLRELSQEPTARGQEAALFLRQRSTPIRQLEERLREKQRELEALRRSRPSSVPREGWSALLDEVATRVLRHAVQRDRLDRGKLYVAAIRGVLALLGPYSRYLGPEEVERQKELHAGFYRGFGLRVTKPGKTDPLVVVSVRRGSPAAEAALHTGDRLLFLNDVATAEFSEAPFERLLASADELTLDVQPLDASEPRRTVTLARSSVGFPYVMHRLLPKNVAYVRVVAFGNETGDEFAAQLARSIENGAERLVLDLRDNRGGLRASAVALIKLFVDSAQGLPIATLHGPGGEVEDVVYPGDDPPRFSLPVVILVNRYTASSAELVAGALRDFGVARLVGEQTYGKGLEQTQIQLQRGSDLLGGPAKIIVSTHEIRLPSGDSFHAARTARGRYLTRRRGGLTPDVAVQSYREEFELEDVVEYAHILFSSDVNEFVRRHLQTVLLRYDEGELWDPSLAGEDFDRLYERFSSEMSRSELQRALRALFRLYVADRRDDEIIAPYEDDRQLQRAILESFRSGEDRKIDVPEVYRGIAELHFGAEELERR